MNSHKKASQVWVLAGGFLGIFSIPLCCFGIMTNMFVIYILARYMKFHGKQQLYGITLATVHTCELFFCLLMLDYFGVGRVWLRGNGYFFEQNGPFGCKTVHFIRQTLTALEINLVFLESFYRYLSIQAFGRFTPTSTLTIFSVCSAIVVSLIITAPTYILNNLWRVDYRYYCAPDPAWSSFIINIYVVHRLILVEGILQLTLIIIFNILTFRELGAYKSLNFILEKAIQDTQINTDILIEIRNYIHNYCNETMMILVHSTVSSLFTIPRAIFFFEIYKVVYVHYKDNVQIDGVLNFYWAYGYYYLQFLFYYFFISCYFWVYFFTMQTFRQSVKKCFLAISKNNVRVGQFIDLFMLGDSLTDRRYIRGSSNLFEQLDAVTLQRLQHLENKNENNTLSHILKM